MRASLSRAGELLLVAACVFLDILVWGNQADLRWGGTVPVWSVTAITAGVYALLLLRWRRPVAVFVSLLLFGLAAGVLLPGYEPFLGLLVALYAVARGSATGRSAAALAACALPFGLNAADAADQDHDDPVTFVIAMLLWVVLGAAVWGFGRLAFAAERRAEERRLEAAAKAQRAERLRLARDLHDVVSNAVNAILLQAAGARRRSPDDPAALSRTLALIEETGAAAMTELHQLLGLLRAADEDTTVSDTPTRPGFDLPALASIEELAERARQAGLVVEIVRSGTARPLPADVQLIGYRVVQEGLSNAMKYAGPGAHVSLRVEWNDRLAIRVRNDVPGAELEGPALAGSGWGIQGLRERAEAVGGAVDVQRLEDGFELTAVLPLDSGVVATAPIPRSRRPVRERVREVTR